MQDKNYLIYNFKIEKTEITLSTTKECYIYQMKYWVANKHDFEKCSMTCKFRRQTQLINISAQNTVYVFHRTFILMKCTDQENIQSISRIFYKKIFS